MYRRIFSLVMITIVMMIMSLPAAAQIQGPQRGYVIGLGGMGATEVNSGLFGVNAGFNLTRDLQVTAEISRLQDVVASFTKEDLAIVDSTVSADTGLPFSSSVRMPTNFYVAGVRYLLPVKGAIRPYVSGGGGIAHMSPEPKFVVAGLDMTNLAMQETLISTTFREETRPMATVGGGLAVTVARHVTFDVGYKYSGIFINTDYLQDYQVSPHNHSRIDTHKIYAGAGVAF